MPRTILIVAIILLALSACTAQDDPGGPGDAPTLTEDSPSTTSWADLPSGLPPTVPYVHGHRYIAPGDRAVKLPSGTEGVSGVVALSDGLLVSDAAYFEGTNAVALVRDGTQVDAWPSAAHCSSGNPVASSRGRFVAWVTVRCPESDDRSVGTIHRSRIDGTREVTQEIAPGLVQVVGFLGRGLVHNRGFQGGAWITDLSSVPRRVPGIDHAVDVSDHTGLLIGQRGERARVVTDSRGKVQWRVKGASLVSFSPNGSSVLAVSRRRLSILRSSDGSLATEVALPTGLDPWTTVWESNRTLLALMHHDGKVAIVRIPIDGRPERVTVAVRLKEEISTPYVLLQPQS